MGSVSSRETTRCSGHRRSSWQHRRDLGAQGPTARPSQLIDFPMADGGTEVIYVGDGLGNDQYLSPAFGILPAGGNGQSGGAVVNAPVAPAIMTLLQQVLATQQATVGRLTCVENNRAQPLLLLQQQQHHQVAAQPPGGAPLGGLMVPWAGGAMGGQQPVAPQEALQQAAVTAGIKTNAKQAADLWRATEGPKFFISRGCFFFTLLLSSYWTSSGHRCHPFSPPVLVFNFYRA